MAIPIPSARPRADLLVLQVEAQRAGWAWACPYSSSDEFEAAVINSRRRAGCYGRSRSRRYAIATAMLVLIAATVGMLLVN